MHALGERAPKRPGRFVVVLALAVVVGAGAALAARTLGLHPVKITSNSMAPTVSSGEWILADDLDEDDRGGVQRGDIVLIRFPLGTSGRAVKRVVALAGDRVEIAPRSVTVNGRVRRIAGAPSRYASRRRLETVPQDSVFLLGDNSAASIDSRSFGAVPETEIVARQLLKIDKPGRTAIAAITVALSTLLLLATWRHRRQAAR